MELTVAISYWAFTHMLYQAVGKNLAFYVVVYCCDNVMTYLDVARR